MITLAAFVLGLCAQPAEAQPVVPISPPPDRTQWLIDHAVPLKTVDAGNGFDDLEPLRKVIGDARIVALGEPTHGTREAFQLKHRLVEFLATQMGFTVFSIEANMPESYRVDDFVSRGQGDPNQLISGMYFWTWRTEEVADMVRWMRAFNESGKGHISFTGFDMQTPDVAMGIAADFLDRAEPEYAGTARSQFESLKTSRSAGMESGFGVATGSFPVEAAAGKHVAYSGWIKTQGVVGGYAGLWWRVDGKNGQVLAFDNMGGRGPHGTTDWTRYSIELDVPADAANINFGVLMPGKGTAWFDDLKVELDGKEFADPATFDFGFEGESLKGLFAHMPKRAASPGYAADLDPAEAHTGNQSLRLEYSGAPGKNVEGPNPAAAQKLARDILAHMESARGAYAAKDGEREADWAIQNARVVAQCYRMNAGNGFQVRDESMAANIKWILDHSPPKTRIILWAHNGHVNREVGRMGSHLARMFGKEMVVIGFSAGEGRYTAMDEHSLGAHDLTPAPPGSFEWHCRGTGLARFILPLRDAAAGDPASLWLTDPVQIRSIGALAMEQQFATQDLTTAYDAVVYLAETTAARQLPR